MTEPIILIRYGLVYVSWTTDREFSGNTVYLVSCDGNCNPPGDEGDLTSFQTAITYGTYIRLGTINSSGRLVPDGNNNANYAYAVATVNYVLEKNFYVIVVEEIPEENKYIVKAHGPSGNPVKATMDIADYGIVLDKDGNGLLVTDDGDGLGITISRPVLTEQDTEAGKNIFDDASQFTYKLNIYRVPSGYDPATAAPGWDHRATYVNGDVVLFDGVSYICAAPGSNPGLIPGSVAGAGIWKVYEADKPMIYQPADGQTLIKTLTLSDGTDDILSADTDTLFNPNTKYKYVLTIYAEQRNGTDKLVSDEYFCGIADGSTASCLKFDTTVTPGELCVVDYEDNITNTQNTYTYTSENGTFSGITFGRMNGDPEYLHFVVIGGNDNAKSAFETWAERNCKEFVEIAHADIPADIKTYDPVITGTIKMELEIPATSDITNVTVSGNSVTYNKQPHGPEDFVTLTGDETGDVITYEFVDAEGNVLSDQTVTNAAETLYVKVTIDRGEYFNLYTRTIQVSLRPAPITVTGTAVSNKDYDGTTTAQVTLGEVGGVYEDDDIEVTASGSFPSADAGEQTVTVTYSISGGVASNYAANPENITATISPIEIEGLSFENIDVTYDRGAHTLVLSGANTTSDIIRYSTDGNTYDLQSCPTYTNAGTYTVYVKVSRANHNDWIRSATLTISKKEISLDSIEVNPVAYGSEAGATTSIASYSLTSGGTALGNEEKNAIVIEWTAVFDDINTLGVHDNVSVTAVLSAEGGTSANYTLTNGNQTVSGIVYTKYTLSQDGKASSGDGSVADGRGAVETTLLYLDFDANPGDVDQNNIAITAGGSYISKTGSGTLTPVLEGSKYRIAVPVAKTGTDSSGVDNVKVTITGVAEIDPSQSNPTPTYLPTAYWGCYPGNDPSIPNVKAYGWGHVLTEAPSTEMINNTQRRYYDVPYDREEPNITTGRPYVLVLKQIGTVSEILNYATPSNPEDETAAYNRVDDNNANGYSGVIAKLAEYSDGTLYKAIVS